jgi:hypothetical protein
MDDVIGFVVIVIQWDETCEKFVVNIDKYVCMW